VAKLPLPGAVDEPITGLRTCVRLNGFVNAARMDGVGTAVIVIEDGARCESAWRWVRPGIGIELGSGGVEAMAVQVRQKQRLSASSLRARTARQRGRVVDDGGAGLRGSNCRCGPRSLKRSCVGVCRHGVRVHAPSKTDRYRRPHWLTCGRQERVRNRSPD